MSDARAACREIIEEMNSGEAFDLDVLKNRAAKKYGLGRVPANSEILGYAKEEEMELILQRLRRKPIRTLSGVAVAAAMARPYPCPGRCIYCPRGEGAPQSYTGEEPAALRAKQAGYDPFLQVTHRLNQLQSIGHPVDKVELIIMGGTFPAQPEDYQEWFVRRCLDAMNSFDGCERSGGLIESQLYNERAGVRNVGVTVETRPDYAKTMDVDRMLRLGVTRAELGVQSLSDEVYSKVDRGHTVEDVVESTRVLKDAGLKVCYHVMPGLFTAMDGDREMFRTLVGDPRFKPDAVKLYPTLVLEGTGLHELWRRGEYKPYTDAEALELITDVKRMMPKWMRTMRIQRDIPARLITAGVRKGDLGELVRKRLLELGERCKCIRCRDAGHLSYREGIEVEGGKVLVEEYDASNGTEYFISIEDVEHDALIGYIRLRMPSKSAHRREINGKTALVRELKVLGQALRLGEPGKGIGQHGGIGSALLARAEESALQNGRNKILVTSAVGTREYYRKRGYERVGPYMGKTIG
ncbi:MAG: tRNA uridine(34) 5-carboxymethylaminomethyl modification radical SAM/GNAT enzyme Elp3 [Candidatus Hydrothermarchaeaceae archaeon]